MKIIMLVILPKRIICDSPQYPHRHGNWQPHILLKHWSNIYCTQNYYIL